MFIVCILNIKMYSVDNLNMYHYIFLEHVYLLYFHSSVMNLIKGFFCGNLRDLRETDGRNIVE